MVKTIFWSFHAFACTGIAMDLVPFTDFLDDVRKSSYADAMSQNGASDFKVRNEDAFEEMREHILSHYDGVNVTESFLDLHHFDCVTVESQPSLRGQKPAAPPPQIPGLKSSLAGAKMSSEGHCGLGTIPMMRVTLQRMLRHKTLQHFFAKSPHGPATEPAQALARSRWGAPHLYAHAYQSVRNAGGSSSLGIWNPQGDFTLSQQWYTAYTRDQSVQTAECGNIHYPAKFGSNAVIFVYGTNNGYAAGSGCYNLDCANFVQTSQDFPLGGSWSSYSSDGDREYANYAFFFYENNWWLSIGGHNLGYYPGSFYSSVDDSAMSVGATEVDFGGETTHDGTDNWPQMGSGQFASAGINHAATHTNILYYAPDGSQAFPASLSPTSNQPCYTIQEAEHDANLGTWFTFGGPGGALSACLTDDAVVV